MLKLLTSETSTKKRGAVFSGMALATSVGGVYSDLGIKSTLRTILEISIVYIRNLISLVPDMLLAHKQSITSCVPSYFEPDPRNHATSVATFAMTFTYKTVLIVGATSGIGVAMADKLVSEGTKVIVSGRRQDRLDAFVQKHGSEKAGAIRFDITDDKGVNSFVHQ